MATKIILPHGGYRNLLTYKKSDVIYQGTAVFVKRFLRRGDRTIDQMVQAARSGKQNIAEASIDGNTSKEMELKLMNVARGSMHELKADYEDYLMNHRLEKWSRDDPRATKTRAYCIAHKDVEDYQKAIEQRSDETIANIAITMLHQYDVLMMRLIEAIKDRFLKEGGIKEEMYRARTEYRKNS